MDVVALYPSTNKEMAKKAIRKAIKIADTTWSNISVKYLTRVVSLMVDRREIERLELDNVIPVPKRTTTLNSFLNPKRTAKETNGDSQFEPVGKHPNERQLKVIIGLFVAESTVVVMSNHF